MVTRRSRTNRPASSWDMTRSFEGVLTCLFVGGHCLLEGVPGLGKTLLVRTLATALDLDFSIGSSSLPT